MMARRRPRFSRAAAIRAKEWAQIWLDPSTFALVVVIPLMLMFLFGSAVSLDTKHVPTGLVDLDRSAASRQLAGAFATGDSFRIVEATALKPLEADMMAGQIRAIIVIPDGFERGLALREPKPIAVLTDGSQPNTATFAAGYARGILANWVAERARERGIRIVPAIDLVPRYNYNPGLQSSFMLVPGAIAIVMAMIGVLLTALIMSREFERGTMEGLLATPISIPSLVFNKLVPYFGLGIASTFVCVLVAIFGYGLPFRGSMFAMFVIASAFLTAVLGQGLMISAATKNQFVSTQTALLSGFVPSLMLSGFLFEIDSMPRAIQLVTYLVPARYLIPAVQSVFLAGDLWSVFLPNIAAMLGFGLFFFWRVTRLITRKVA